MRANHTHVFYDDLIADLNKERDRLFTFLRHDSSDFDCSMSRELLRPEHRLSAVFGPEVRQWLREHLLSYSTIREAVLRARETTGRQRSHLAGARL